MKIRSTHLGTRMGRFESALRVVFGITGGAVFAALSIDRTGAGHPDGLDERPAPQTVNTVLDGPPDRRAREGNAIGADVMRWPYAQSADSARQAPATASAGRLASATPAGRSTAGAPPIAMPPTAHESVMCRSVESARPRAPPAGRASQRPPVVGPPGAPPSLIATRNNSPSGIAATSRPAASSLS